LTVDEPISLQKGHLYSKGITEENNLLEWLDVQSQTNENHIVYISRTPHRRLLNEIDVTKIETYWMTHRAGQAHISPDFDQIHTMIQSRIHNHRGIIVLEGLEWLVSLHGETTLLNFIRTLRDDVHRTQWSILLPLDELAFSSIWLARFKREAPALAMPKEQEIFQNEQIEEITQIPVLPTQVNEEGLPELVMLNKLPHVGFTRVILRKRILQWRRMGLDVSEVEPALHMNDDHAYELYSKVEEKVRTAVELERAIEANRDLLSATELTTSKFRIRQLTGLEEIRSKLQSV